MRESNLFRRLTTALLHHTRLQPRNPKVKGFVTDKWQQKPSNDEKLHFSNNVGQTIALLGTWGLVHRADSIRLDWLSCWKAGVILRPERFRCFDAIRNRDLASIVEVPLPFQLSKTILNKTWNHRLHCVRSCICWCILNGNEGCNVPWRKLPGATSCSRH